MRYLAQMISTCLRATETYGDTDSEKRNAVRQSIIHSDGCTLNYMKLRISSGGKDATNAQDDAIAKAYGNKFIIPLDFKMLDSVMPHYQV